jgi:hypothetical protein
VREVRSFPNRHGACGPAPFEGVKKSMRCESEPRQGRFQRIAHGFKPWVNVPFRIPPWNGRFQLGLANKSSLQMDRTPGQRAVGSHIARSRAPKVLGTGFPTAEAVGYELESPLPGLRSRPCAHFLRPSSGVALFPVLKIRIPK